MIARSVWARASGSAAGVSARGRPSAATMNACASSESGNALASHAPQTTPPAAPEKPTRCSPSPHPAHAASCGAKPAASSSLSRKASEFARPARAGIAVEQRQFVGQQVVHAGVRVAVVEDPRDGLAGPRGAVQRAGVLAQARVRGDGLGRRHGQEIAAPLIQDEVETEERLEPPTEPRLRLADALRDRAQPAARRGIQMEDAVRFAVAKRAEDDSFGLYRSGYRTILSEVMSQVTVYTTEPCGYCRVAKALLAKRGVTYEEINLAKDPEGRAELVRLTGMMTFPQVVIGGESVGGYQELVALDRAGGLAEFVAA